ncbi:hypothetical protein GCM10022225_02870 [Plantactinospora mayteni]|uniref:DUF4352 domain-containing protein n=1 Tax=Plantactinospora mayteni TaxID=566021 RepID=A0ABQ4EQ45_9ACTN|nr:hypothetical protein [Plantactinospora mayteni]GIG96775.1 hypothetical protein Pma05_33480 [Plantactinospora mayteni]
MTVPTDYPDPDSVTSHRAPPGPGQRMGLRAGAGTLIVAALAVGGAIANWRPINGGGAEARERPFVQAGRFGETVSTRVFDATVLDVRGAAKVSNGGQSHDTAGVWIVLRVRLATRDRAMSIGYAALRDQRDREFRATTRFTQPLVGAGRVLQPGIPVEGDLAFEVPRDAATRLSAYFGQEQIDIRMDDLAEVLLPTVDKARVDEWASAPAPVPLASARAVAP